MATNIPDLSLIAAQQGQAAAGAAPAAPATSQPAQGNAAPQAGGQTPGSTEQRDVASLSNVPFTADDVKWAQSIADALSPKEEAPTEAPSPDVNLLGRLPERVNIPLNWLGLGKKRIKFNLPHKLMISGETADIIGKSLASAYKDVPGGGFGKGFAIGAGGIRSEMAAKRKADFEAKKKSYLDALTANKKIAMDYSSNLLKERLKGKTPEKMSAYVKVTDEEKKFLERRGNKVPADNVVPRAWFEALKPTSDKLSLSEQIRAEDALSAAWDRKSKKFVEMQDQVRLALVYKDAAPSNIGDNALVAAMARFTDDKTGVKDAERDLWAKAQGLWLTWKNKVTELSGNGFLDPDARQQMKDLIMGGYKAALRYNLQQRKTFIAKAKQRGLDPDIAVPMQVDESIFPADPYQTLGITP